jgi:hypothetical protein
MTLSRKIAAALDENTRATIFRAPSQSMKARTE